MIIAQTQYFPPPFPVTESQARLGAQRAVMIERRIDCIVVDQFEHIVISAGIC